jgi:hypothetical protein
VVALEYPRIASPNLTLIRMSETPRQGPGLLTHLGAELAVIVLGVLIALWADGWVAARADREIERNRVEALRDNVAATRIRLSGARARERAPVSARRADGRVPKSSALNLETCG